MTSLFLNAPYWLVGLLALVGLGLLLSGLKRMQSNLRTGGLALLGAAVVLLILRAVVPTAEKKVEKEVRGLFDAISANDWDAVGRYTAHAQLRLSQSSSNVWEGPEIAVEGKKRSAEYGLTSLTINSLEIQSQPNVIVVTISVTTHHKGIFVDNVPSVWSLEYQQRNGDWVLTNIVPVRIGGAGGRRRIRRTS